MIYASDAREKARNYNKQHETVLMNRFHAWVEEQANRGKFEGQFNLSDDEDFTKDQYNYLRNLGYSLRRETCDYENVYYNVRW